MTVSMSTSRSAHSGHPGPPPGDADDLDEQIFAAEAAAVAKRRRKVTATYVGLVVLLVVTVFASVVVGQYGSAVGESLRSLLRVLGLAAPSADGAGLDAVMWQVRLPRIVLALLVGAGLAISGVALQAIFGNPLAEPGLIGVSSGAAVGASAMTVAGGVALPAFLGTSASDWMIAGGAFLGGALATAIVAVTARGGRDVARVILVGVAVNAVCGGLVSLLTFVADASARDRIVFWQMGSFAGANWSAVVIVAVVTIPGAAFLWTLARKFDLLSLGEAQAGHLGIDVPKLRRIAIGVTALIVAVGVAFSGIIVFIGLVIPHALRLIIGPGHRALIPASVLGGAVAAAAADLAARTVVAGADLPLGMLTALVGGPVFFWLLLRGGRAVKR